jgi:two-component system, LytTR family, response regulator
MIRAIIVDDEESCRETLLSALKKYCPQVHVLGQAKSVKTGLALILEMKPDLVFLDVQMPDGTGFDLLGKIKEINFKTIFATAFDTFAVKAFKFSAIDYLLKPVDPEELVSAVSKLDSGNRLDELNLKLEALLGNKNNFEKIALPAMDGIRLIRLNDIIRCESDSNYTYFFTTAKEKIVVTRTLKEYEEMLTPMKFFRVHQSHLVNLAHVVKYIKGEGGSVIMDDGSEVEVARRRKEEFLSLLTNT